MATGYPGANRPRRTIVAVLAALTVTALAVPGVSSAASLTRSRASAAIDDANLRLAAAALEEQALSSGALKRPLALHAPAKVILAADEALIREARSQDPSRRPTDTESFMGPLPYYLAHELSRRPAHLHITRTRTLHRYTHSVPVAGSDGFGHQNRFAGKFPATFRKPNGVYVDPRLPAPAHPTVAIVALRTALRALGQPYVWAGAGPSVYDCSGLVMRAFGRAGIRLIHHAGSQWNEGRLIPARDALPGDLVMFGDPIFHVAIYLGAGWMLNAPFTGHYVDVVPVWSDVAGVVRL